MKGVDSPLAANARRVLVFQLREFEVHRGDDDLAVALWGEHLGPLKRRRLILTIATNEARQRSS
jgi:hypothetical protein